MSSLLGAILRTISKDYKRDEPYRLSVNPKPSRTSRYSEPYRNYAQIAGLSVPDCLPGLHEVLEDWTGIEGCQNLVSPSWGALNIEGCIIMGTQWGLLFWQSPTAPGS